MAILDDNNSAVASGFGRDPLAELDAELERLRTEMGDEQPEEKNPHEAHTRPHIAGVITALILAVVCAASTLCACSPSGTDTAEPNDEPPTVTVNDPDLGEVVLQPPTDAPVNEYHTENLTLGDDGYYTYTVDGVKVSEMGIDLSSNQEYVDFDAVKESGIDFVILRIGGRGWGNGSLYADSKFDEFYEQARDAGLKIGAYFFSQAISNAEAVEEAQYVLELLDGRELTYPIAFDFEIIDDDVARTDDLTNSQITGLAAAFCGTIEAAGYRTMVYANTSLILQTYDFNVMKDYDFWLADYREMPERDMMYYRYSVWQYSETGSVPGIDGAVDLNLCLNANQVTP